MSDRNFSPNPDRFDDVEGHMISNRPSDDHDRKFSADAADEPAETDGHDVEGHVTRINRPVDEEVPGWRTATDEGENGEPGYLV